MNFAGRIITVVNHDEGINSRFCPYNRLAWVMFLAFPLDFQKDIYVKAAIAPFGRCLAWYMDANRSRILARVLLLSPNRVPHSLVVSRGTTLGGIGRSWSVPVYIMNGNFPDVIPADEDPVPLDGEPHPEHGPPVMGANPVFPEWQEENQGADINHGAHGGNPHHNPAQQLHPAGFAAPAANNEGIANQGAINNADEWPAWNPAPIQQPPPQPAQAVIIQEVPQHPQFPQDMIDIDHSGSSMRFLRANGPDIPLDWVLAPDSDEDSSSSSDATSLLLEQQLKQTAASNQCAQQLLYNVPAGFTLRGIFAPGASSSTRQADTLRPLRLGLPIVLQNSIGQEPQSREPELISTHSGLETVPWQPTPAAVALEVYAQVADHLQRQQQAPAEPRINSESQQPSHQSPAQFGPEFEAVTSLNEPTPTAAEEPPNRPREGNVRLPSVPSARNRSTPVTEAAVRRSPRLRAENYTHVWLHRDTPKKRKIAAISISNSEGQAGPVPMATLRSWGLDCGVAPSELTDEALMQSASEYTASDDHE